MITTIRTKWQTTNGHKADITNKHCSAMCVLWVYWTPGIASVIRHCCFLIGNGCTSNLQLICWKTIEVASLNHGNCGIARMFNKPREFTQCQATYWCLHSQLSWEVFPVLSVSESYCVQRQHYCQQCVNEQLDCRVWHQTQDLTSGWSCRLVVMCSPCGQKPSNTAPLQLYNSSAINKGRRYRQTCLGSCCKWMTWSWWQTVSRVCRRMHCNGDPEWKFENEYLENKKWLAMINNTVWKRKANGFCSMCDI